MVKMSEQKDLSADKATVVGGGFNINPLDIIMYLLSRWYWFVISIALPAGRNRYVIPLFNLFRHIDIPLKICKFPFSI